LTLRVSEHRRFFLGSTFHLLPRQITVWLDRRMGIVDQLRREFERIRDAHGAAARERVGYRAI
jgi:hypothetical protein